MARPRAAKPKSAALAWGSYRAANDLDARRTSIDGTADFHADQDTRNRLRRLSRSADRNASLYSGPLTQALGFLLGDGSWPRPRWGSDVKDADERTRRWVAAASSARFDADGILALHQILEAHGRSVIRDGDAAAVHDGRGAVQLVESERIVGPGVGVAITVQGVQFAGRIPSAYWIAAPDRLGRIIGGKAKSFPAQRVTFTAHRDRSGQVRGIPMLAASLDDLDHLDSLGEAEIRSAESASLPTAYLETPENGPAPPNGTIRTEAATMIALPPGVKAVASNMGRPNLDVPEFQRLNMRVAFMTLGLPLELLLLDLGQLNYSASRSLRNLAEDRLGRLRRWLWHPILDRMVSDWQRAEGMGPVAPTWDWPRLQLHDRNKESEADDAELSAGTSSLQRICGHDWEAIQRENAAAALLRVTLRAEIVTAAIAAAQRISTPTAAVVWQDIYIDPFLPGPARFTASDPKPPLAPANSQQPEAPAA